MRPATLGILTAGVVVAAFVLLVALAAGTCGSGDSIDRVPLTIVTANGTTARLDVELARTEEERQTGLMNRTELLPDTGMLFVVAQPPRGFYMRNTRLHLTVAFIAECGEIIEFADLEPLSEEIVNPDEPYSFGLEVDRGWFERNGISIGDIVSLPQEVRPAGC